MRQKSYELSRQAGASNPPQISPEGMLAFEDLFLDWLDRPGTREELEAGSTGELEPLAQQMLLWALGLDLPRGRER
jgi:hypothetical protein